MNRKWGKKWMAAMLSISMVIGMFPGVGNPVRVLADEPPGQAVTQADISNADNSGNYVGYPEIKNEKIGGLDVSLKEKDGKVVLAIWSDGAYSYSISLDEQGVSLEEMTALVKAVK